MEARSCTLMWKFQTRQAPRLHHAGCVKSIKKGDMPLIAQDSNADLVEVDISMSTVR